MEKERLNIQSRATDWRAKILANPTDTPFTYGGYLFTSLESALQGIKFSDPDFQKQIFAMRGIDALRIGRQITLSIKSGEEHYVYWQNERIVYNSLDHRLLLAAFIQEKVRQNVDVQKALLATDGLFIYHDVGEESPHTSLPEKFFIRVLVHERDLLLLLQSLSINSD